MMHLQKNIKLSYSYVRIYHMIKEVEINSPLKIVP